MMKKLTDEEIQKLLESKAYTCAPSDLNEDAKLYELVFEELSKEPDFTLPKDFSYKVTETIWQQTSRYSFITPNVIIGISIISALLVSIGAILFINVNIIIDLFAVAVTLKWIILFVLAVLALIELGDKFFVRRRIT